MLPAAPEAGNRSSTAPPKRSLRGTLARYTSSINVAKESTSTFRAIVEVKLSHATTGEALESRVSQVGIGDVWEVDASRVIKAQRTLHSERKMIKLNATNGTKCKPCARAVKQKRKARWMAQEAREQLWEAGMQRQAAERELWEAEMQRQAAERERQAAREKRQAAQTLSQAKTILVMHIRRINFVDRFTFESGSIDRQYEGCTASCNFRYDDYHSADVALFSEDGRLRAIIDVELSRAKREETLESKVYRVGAQNVWEVDASRVIHLQSRLRSAEGSVDLVARNRSDFYRSLGGGRLLGVAFPNP